MKEFNLHDTGILQEYVYSDKIQQIMGQELCKQTSDQQQIYNNSNIEGESPFYQLEESNLDRSVAHSRLNIRASALKKQQSSLSNNIKSRLKQLPTISQTGRSNLVDQSKHVFIQSLNANYEGEMSNGMPNGAGSILYQNGDYLQGEFVNGSCEGKGRMIKKDGSYYQGDIKNNVADGYGRYIDNSGYIYEGQWKHNQPNGKGEAMYNDDSRYNGEFLNNKKQGKGVLMQRGCIFEGDFVDDKLSGYAIMQSDNGEIYRGDWKDNEKHGEGQYFWPNGNVYKGTYKNGKKEGFGVMNYNNGQYYEGNWKDGLKHGQGKYKSFKKIIVGEWRNGQLVSQSENKTRERF